MSLIERSFREKIVLVGVTLPPDGVFAPGLESVLAPAGRGDEDETERHLDELALLVATAGADVVARVHQRRARPDPATYIGKGKAHELREVSEATDADTVVFDDELTPAQSRNLEKILGRTAIDRTAVILDIFAQNASTEEGKVQVELAQLRYRLPRLRGRGVALSQQAGRIGTRGPGETQLEVDRRRLVRRVHRLEEELAELEGRRRTQRQSRRRSRLYSVSLVGYTNAGKSTLLNSLTGAGAEADARLFATLDPRTKRFTLPGGEPVLISDTVGFVRKLPHQLVEAFRSTLEVVKEADLLVHLVDSSSPDTDAQIDAVRAVLGEIGAGDIPELMVFNKSDLAQVGAELLCRRHPGSLAISAATGAGRERLLAAVAAQLRSTNRVLRLSVPFSRGDVMAALHREGEVLSAVEETSATQVDVKLPLAAFSQFEPFIVAHDGGGAAQKGA
ncbi:MAG TPA: GTPase HflX [Acidimicrobiales bacterium]|nr:GTPase HflX [Acidimicrobiales bacterium]